MGSEEFRHGGSCFRARRRCRRGLRGALCVPCQVVGYKYVRLFERSQSAFLYAIKGGGDGVEAQGNMSAVDVENPDLKVQRSHRIIGSSTTGAALPSDRLACPFAGAPALCKRRIHRRHSRPGRHALRPRGRLALRPQPHPLLFDFLLVLTSVCPPLEASASGHRCALRGA